MALPQKKIKTKVLYTEEEYLALEREAEERHEYLDGEIRAMAGESEQHADICTNLLGELYAQLKGTHCRARSKDTKVRSGPKPKIKDKRRSKGLFSYPDIVVICGEPQYLDDYKDIVLNPAVIIEVLSESTETFDTNVKFLRYVNWNHSLTDYILVAQDFPMVSHYSRRGNGEWICRIFQDLEMGFNIDSIDCQLILSDIYDRVEFPPEDEDEIEDVESQNTN